MAAKGKEVVKQETQLPALDLYEQEAGAGLETATTQDYAIPFLQILQSGSPQLDKSQGEFIKGAVAGQILNTVSNKVYDDVTVVPCAFVHKVVEWKPRGSGGGLVAQHDREATAEFQVSINDKGQMQTQRGTILMPTAYHYVLVIDPDGTEFEQSVISMTSTQLKKSKKWNSLMGALKLKGKSGDMFTPPTYSHRYTLSTVGEQNDKGKWFGWSIQNGTLIENIALIAAARAFSQSARNISIKPVSEDNVM